MKFKIFITLSILIFSVSFSFSAEITEGGLPVQMTKDNVVRLSKTGVSDAIIINQINATHTIFEMTNDDIIQLKNEGVSDNVISYMQQSTLSTAPRAILVDDSPSVSINHEFYGDPWYDPSPWAGDDWDGFWYGPNEGDYHHHDGGHHHH